MRKMRLLTICALLFMWVLSIVDANAQIVSLRTNLLYDATLSPNIGAELRVDSTWSFGMNIGVNAWDIDKDKNKKWRHILISPNVRKYFGNKTVKAEYNRMDSTYRPRYFEANLIYSHFNVGNTRIPFGLYSAIKDRRLQGDLIALGGKYGYSWILSRDWRLEAEAGIAVGYAWFKEYDCDHCGTFYGKGDRIFLLPQLGINVVYIIN